MWHAGERAVQERAGVTEIADRMLGTQEPVIPPVAREFLSEQPWIVLGAADEDGRPWASPLYGEPGFITTPDESTVHIAAHPLAGDPLTRIDGAVGALALEPATTPADAAQRARDHRRRRHHDRARAGLLELPEVHRHPAPDATRRKTPSDTRAAASTNLRAPARARTRPSSPPARRRAPTSPPRRPPGLPPRRRRHGELAGLPGQRDVQHARQPRRRPRVRADRRRPRGRDDAVPDRPSDRRRRPPRHAADRRRDPARPRRAAALVARDARAATRAAPEAAGARRRRSHSTSCSSASSTLKRRPSSAETTSRRSRSGVEERSHGVLAQRAQPASPLPVHVARAGRAQQLDLQPIQRGRDLALLGRLPDQPVGQLLGPGRRVRVGVAQAQRDLGDPPDLPLRRPLQRGLQDVLLGGEVPRRRGERDLRLAGDPAMGDRGDALARDDPHRRHDDRLADLPRGLGAHGHPPDRTGTFVLALAVRTY